MRKTEEGLTEQRLKQVLHYDPDMGKFWRKAEPRKEETISIDRLRDVLDYDPEAGKFFWKQKTGRKNIAGQEAGYVKVVSSGHSYKYIRIDGVAYLTGRLAWFYIHGEWPRMLKFRDGDALNCAIDNLEDPDITITDKSQRGYGYIRIDGRDHTAARLAWLWFYGKYPHGVVRFVDGNRENFRISNLRDSADLAKTDQDRHDERRVQYERERDKSRDERFRAKYGITLGEYKERLAAQDDKCAICGKPESATRNGKVRWLAIDHCHSTQRIRGLLCGACNVMIGHAKDDIQVLENAVAYLRKNGVA